MPFGKENMLAITFCKLKIKTALGSYFQCETVILRYKYFFQEYLSHFATCNTEVRHTFEHFLK